MNELVFDRAKTAERLRQSLEVIEWASELVPSRFTHANPDWYPDDAWSVAMNIAHVVIYEDQMANPVLDDLLKGGDGVAMVKSDVESWFVKDAIALASEPLDLLLNRLRQVRLCAITMVDAFDPARWNKPMTPLWNSGTHGAGPHSPAWVANKTFQHTWDHGNAILAMALFTPR